MSLLDSGLEEWLLSRCGRAVEAERSVSTRLGVGDPLLRLELDGRAKVDVRGWHWSFIYKSQDDERRSVRLTTITAAEDGFLVRGFDLSRKAPREFRAHEICDCCDAVTGEVIEDPAGIAKIMLNGAKPSVLASILPEVRDGCYVLCAIAAADGVVYDDELEAILIFVDRVASERGLLLAAEDFSLLKPLLRGFRPTPKTVLAALARCAQAGHLGPLLLRSIRDLCHRDDHLSQAEQQIVQMFARALAFYREHGRSPRPDDWQQSDELY